MTTATLTRPLTSKQQLFLEQLPLCNMNAADAYSKAYPNLSRESAARGGYGLMQDPRVKAALEATRAELRQANQMRTQDVLQHIFELATADPRELAEVWIGPCRYCHGDGHLWQRTAGEMDRDFDAYTANKKTMKIDPDGLMFDRKGGIGFNRRVAPHHDCPECGGLGERYEVLKDTRNFSPAAARLYAGVKVGRDGSIEIKTRSQDKALEFAGRCLGLFRDQVDIGGQRGPGAVPVPVVAFAASSPQEAATLYQKLLAVGV